MVKRRSTKKRARRRTKKVRFPWGLDLRTHNFKRLGQLANVVVCLRWRGKKEKMRRRECNIKSTDKTSHKFLLQQKNILQIFCFIHNLTAHTILKQNTSSKQNVFSYFHFFFFKRNLLIISLLGVFFFSWGMLSTSQTWGRLTRWNGTFFFLELSGRITITPPPPLFFHQEKSALTIS